MLGRVIRGMFGSAPTPDYEKQKQAAETGSARAKRDLALREDSKPEILYYLAEDADPAVRRAVAANAAAPRQANLLLTADADADVRAELAGKIQKLLPDLAPTQTERLRDLTVKTIDTLAQDQLPRVRAILAEAIKESPYIPKAVALKLARDVEAEVAAPILEFSPLLNDADLREIIASGVASAALAAIARRRELSGDLADAIVATIDVPAIATLLANRSAQVREETLDRIIETAKGVDALHRPLVFRPELSMRAIRRIAEFVSAALLERLSERHGLDEAVRGELRAQAKRRLAEEEPELTVGGDGDEVAAALDRGDRSFVMNYLAQKSGLPVPGVERVFTLRSPRGIVALAWAAGLSMRLALRLQSEIAGIGPREMVYARNGTDYPFAPEELTQQLDFFRAA